MKRAMLMAISAILALTVAVPVASAKSPSGSQNLPALTAAWWNWATSQDPSPLQGDYEGGAQCEGEYVDGVFFLAGTAGWDASRTCTVPADTPILFPVFNVVCSEAFGAAGQDQPDPTPYDTACAKPLTDDALANGDTYATLDGKKLRTTRIASGVFTWNIQFANNPYGLPVGTWPSATDGVWVYLPQGLDPGEYTLEFGGEFYDDAFSVNTTYDLIVVE